MKVRPAASCLVDARPHAGDENVAVVRLETGDDPELTSIGDVVAAFGTESR